MSESAIEKAISEAIEQRIRPLENEIAELKSRIPGDSWTIAQVASELGCSVTTTRRRIKNDPQFPPPLKKTKYEHDGKIRTTHSRWDPEEVKQYKAYLNRDASSAAVGL